jgi:HK97 family phage portal protein
MRSLLARLVRWLARKMTPATIRDGFSERPSFVDVYRRLRTPSPHELLAELKNTAYACATLNASVCATYPPRLFVSTRSGEASPRCLTRSLTPHERHDLFRRPDLAPRLKGAEQVEEVLDHPLLTLLRAVNPTHNAHDLWELTALYQEVHGAAYWQLSFDSLGVPDAIWILPSQNVQPVREPDSLLLVDYYAVQTRTGTLRIAPRDIIHFRCPDPRDPYGPGLSPLRAAYEHVAMASEFLAYKRSVWVNNALPSVVISPSEIISEEERDRLEAAWLQKFSRGGNGRVLVAESNLSVDVVNPSMGDLAALAEAGATKEEIANVFGVPMAYLTTQTNLANLQAAEHQHASLTIRPRLCRRDEKINEQLIPLYDPSGRLFVASDDPTPRNQAQQLEQDTVDLHWGVRTINEVRASRGLPPVSWGETPWLPVNLAPPDFPHRDAIVEDTGRGRVAARQP